MKWRLVMICAAVLAAWTAWQVTDGSQLHRLATSLISRGARIEYRDGSPILLDASSMLRDEAGHLSPDDLQAITRLTSLEKLDISNAKLKSGEFSQISSLSRLEVLDCRGNTVGDEGFGAIAQLKELRRLLIQEFDPGPVAAQALAQCTRLTEIGIPIDAFDCDSFKLLRNLPLDTISVNGRCLDWDPEALEILRNFPLKRLELLRDCSEEVLTLFPQPIVELDVDQRVTGHCLKMLRCQDSLKYFLLPAAPHFDDEGCKQLSDFKRLRVVLLPHSRSMTDEGVRFLSDLPDLEMLDLAGCPQLTEQVFEMLKSLPRLRLLSCQGIPVSDSSIELLLSYPALRGVDLELFGKSSLVSEEAAARIKKLLSSRSIMLVPETFPEICIPWNPFDKRIEY